MSSVTATVRLIPFAFVVLSVVISVSGNPRPQGESAGAPFETRCGWFVNPTPGNIWLYDRHGEWTIGVQGGYQVEGEWEWPEFKDGQWVRTNVNYGYGCACLDLRVNRETHEVLEIKRARARPLSACRRDRALAKWKRVLG